LQAYNAMVLQTFADVASAQRANQDGPLADALPLMHQRGVDAHRAATAAQQPPSHLLTTLLQSRAAGPAGARPHRTLQSLLLSLPSGTFDAFAIPVLHGCDPHGRAFQLNSYAYDFYNHGIYRSIVRVNQLPDSRCYHLLADWKSTLLTIVTAVEQLAKSDAHSRTLLSALTYAKEKFTANLENCKRNF